MNSGTPSPLATGVCHILADGSCQPTPAHWSLAPAINMLSRRYCLVARSSCARNTANSPAMASLFPDSSSRLRSSREMTEDRTVPVSLPVVQDRSCGATSASHAGAQVSRGTNTTHKGLQDGRVFRETHPVTDADTRRARDLLLVRHELVLRPQHLCQRLVLHLVALNPPVVAAGEQMIRETQGKKLAKREQDDDAEHSLLPKLGHAVVVLRERVHARHRGCSALAEAARTFPAGPFTGARVQPSGRSHNEDSRSRY